MNKNTYPAILVITTHGGWECDISGAFNSCSTKPTVEFKKFKNPLNNVTILRATEGNIPNYLDQKIPNSIYRLIKKIAQYNYDSDTMINKIKEELISLDKKYALTTLASSDSIRNTPMRQHQAEIDIEKYREMQRERNIEKIDLDKIEEYRANALDGEIFLNQKNPYSIVKKTLNEELGDKYFVTYAEERALNRYQINDNRIQLYIPKENRYSNAGVDIIPTWSPAVEQATQGAKTIILKRRDEYATNLSNILEEIKIMEIKNLLIIDLTCNTIMYEGEEKNLENCKLERIKRIAVRELRNQILRKMDGV